MLIFVLCDITIVQPQTSNCSTGTHARRRCRYALWWSIDRSYFKI